MVYCNVNLCGIRRWSLGIEVIEVNYEVRLKGSEVGGGQWSALALHVDQYAGSKCVWEYVKSQRVTIIRGVIKWLS